MSFSRQAYDAIYYSENREKILARKRKRYVEGREQMKIRHAKYREDNREKVRAAVKLHTEMHPRRAAFQRQRSMAGTRGIEFLFTLEVWKKFWGDRFEFRGRGADALCMGRYDDRGPYSLGNVYICSNSENASAPRPLPEPGF